VNDLSKSNTNQSQQASWIETKNNAISEMTTRISTLQDQINNKVTIFYILSVFFIGFTTPHFPIPIYVSFNV